MTDASVHFFLFSPIQGRVLFVYSDYPSTIQISIVDYLFYYYVFTGICLSNGGGGGVDDVWSERGWSGNHQPSPSPDQAPTPPPLRPGTYPPPPPGPDTHLRPGTYRLGTTVNARAVRILLESILV